MGYVHGHWRETGWVRAHFRHPLRPGLDQAGLVFLVVSPVRIDLGRYGAEAPCCPLTDRPGVPAPRLPSEPAADRVRPSRRAAHDPMTPRGV